MILYGCRFVTVGSVLAIGLALWLRRHQLHKHHQALLSSSSIQPAGKGYFGGTTTTGSGNTTGDIEAGIDEEVR